jgi:hypothetical protein
MAQKQSKELEMYSRKLVPLEDLLSLSSHQDYKSWPDPRLLRD